MTLQQTPSKTGGRFCSWKINWTEEGKVKGRSFAWSSYADRDNNGSWEAYRAGALCRIAADLRTHGCSKIDPGEDELRALFHQAMKIYSSKVA